MRILAAVGQFAIAYLVGLLAIVFAIIPHAVIMLLLHVIVEGLLFPAVIGYAVTQRLFGWGAPDFNAAYHARMRAKDDLRQRRRGANKP